MNEVCDTCNIFAEEECLDKHYKNNTRILTNDSTKNTQKIEDNNHLSWLRI